MSLMGDMKAPGEAQRAQSSPTGSAASSPCLTAYDDSSFDFPPSQSNGRSIPAFVCIFDREEESVRPKRLASDPRLHPLLASNQGPHCRSEPALPCGAQEDVQGTFLSEESPRRRSDQALPLRYLSRAESSQEPPRALLSEEWPPAGSEQELLGSSQEDLLGALLSEEGPPHGSEEALPGSTQEELPQEPPGALLSEEWQPTGCEQELPSSTPEDLPEEPPGAMLLEERESAPVAAPVAAEEPPAQEGPGAQGLAAAQQAAFVESASAASSSSGSGRPSTPRLQLPKNFKSPRMKLRSLLAILLGLLAALMVLPDLEPPAPPVTRLPAAKQMLRTARREVRRDIRRQRKATRAATAPKTVHLPEWKAPLQAVGSQLKVRLPEWKAPLRAVGSQLKARLPASNALEAVGSQIKVNLGKVRFQPLWKRDSVLAKGVPPKVHRRRAKETPAAFFGPEWRDDARLSPGRHEDQNLQPGELPAPRQEKPLEEVENYGPEMLGLLISQSEIESQMLHLRMESTQVAFEHPEEGELVL